MATNEIMAIVRQSLHEDLCSNFFPITYSIKFVLFIDTANWMMASLDVP